MLFVCEGGKVKDFPPHKCGLYLAHNEHKDIYQCLETFIPDNDLMDFFRGPGAVAKSIESGELWDLQWYPDTPNGFLRVCAPTLEELLEYTNEVSK